MIKRIAQGSVLFATFLMSMLAVPQVALAAGMAGMNCDQCTQQCEQRKSAMTGQNSRTSSVGPVRIASVVTRSTHQTGLSGRVMGAADNDSCQAQCSRLSVSLCLRGCQQGGKKLSSACQHQCGGMVGKDRDFCMQTCSSSQSQSGCVQNCQQARCF